MNRRTMKTAIILILIFFAFQVKAQLWNLVWADEFNYSGLPDESKWGNEVGCIRNNELQYYTNRRIENSIVANGALQIIGRKESYASANYTSASLTTDGKHSWTYGKIEARMKLPSGQGMWPAFWLLGQNMKQVGWPKCGEIDIMEHINIENRDYGTMHWNNNGHVSYGGYVYCDVQQYHVYSIEWDEKGIVWLLDGNKFWEGNILNNINSTEEFHKPFYIILNLAIGGSWPGNPDATTSFPDTLSVDYVRVYQKTINTSLATFHGNNISISPNPTMDFVTIAIPELYVKGNLSISDLLGNELLTQPINDKITQISLASLPGGVYILKYKNSMVNVTRKILKE
jgi:beta-glucanase (GH16 family)